MVFVLRDVAVLDEVADIESPEDLALIPTYSGFTVHTRRLPASLAARRNARPTATEKSSGFFARVLALMALSPVTAAADQSSRKPPMNPPSVGRYSGSLPASRESPDDIEPRHIVSALVHTRCNASQRQLYRPGPKINDVNAVAGALPLFQSLHVGQSAERRLKGKILSRRGGEAGRPHRPSTCDSPDGSTTRHTGEKKWRYIESGSCGVITHARHVEGRYRRRCRAACSARSRSHFKSTWSTVAGFMRAVTLRASLLRCPI